MAMSAGVSAVSSPGHAGAGGCLAWPLPLDSTCASAARSLFGETTAEMGLPDDVIEDGVTMASELAANTLHAHGNVEFDGSRQRAVTGFPQLWLYFRGRDSDCELVCKVFDSQRGWVGPPPDPAAPASGSGASLDAVRGRGLQVVAGLSGDRWGHHLTRARLGRWKVQGKAVWFALPVPRGCVPGYLRGHWNRARAASGACWAGEELETMLANRGIVNRLIRAEEPAADISVLSVRLGLTVWCRRGQATWTTPDGGYASCPLMDLVEAEEEVVRVHEELDRATAALL